MKVLFICWGNVARSQMAEAFFKKMYDGEEWEVESAGTQAIERGYAGRKVEDITMGIVDCMNEEEIDISKKVSKQLTEKMLEESDRVIVMAEKDTWPEFLRECEKVEYWDVIDPEDQKGINFQRKIRDEIRKRVRELVDEI